MVAFDEGEKFMGQSLIRRTWLAIAEDLMITVLIFVMKFCFVDVRSWVFVCEVKTFEVKL